MGRTRVAGEAPSNERRSGAETSGIQATGVAGRASRERQSLQRTVGRRRPRWSVAPVVIALGTGFLAARSVRAEDAEVVLRMRPSIEWTVDGHDGEAHRAQASPTLNVELPFGLVDALEIRWHWRLGEGDWQPLPFEGQRFVGLVQGSALDLVAAATGRLDGAVTVDPQPTHGFLPLRQLDLAVIVEQVDGRLQLRPWLECRLDGIEADAADARWAALPDGLALEPLPEPERLALPTAGSLAFVPGLVSEAQGRAFEASYTLLLAPRSDGAAPAAPLEVRLSLNCGSLPKDRD